MVDAPKSISFIWFFIFKSDPFSDWVDYLDTNYLALAFLFVIGHKSMQRLSGLMSLWMILMPWRSSNILRTYIPILTESKHWILISLLNNTSFRLKLNLVITMKWESEFMSKAMAASPGTSPQSRISENPSIFFSLMVNIVWISCRLS